MCVCFDFPASGKPDLRISALVVMAPPVLPERTNGFPEPFRELRPKKPEDDEEKSRGNERLLHLRTPEKGHNERERGIEEKESKPQPRKKGKESQAHGNLGLRCREFPATTL